MRVSHDFPANVTYFHLNSYDSRATFVRVSRDIHASVARHSYECRLVLFSRQIVARFSQDCRATVMRHSHDICTSVTKNSHCKFAKISRRQVCDTRTTVARQSCEIFWRKNSHKIFQHVEKLRDQFATQGNSHDTRTNVVRKSATKFAKQSREIRMPVRY